eukprot:TRINITY_DN3341_c0_g1_i2.p1 TRINITY_DN3341_c0_g1~~TRINITY_DN3341_c0_g1_i2.p1  ORF type:complete len:533 (+),score=142.31 TRINITY_DN3341_c0_g1_i2:681-2279(+)
MESLSYRHIVSFYGAQETEKHINLILEYVDSGSLASIISKYGVLSETLAGIYTEQVLLGLEYLHENKVVHRDLKGNNILITMDGTVKLADFGIAMLYQSKEATAKDLGENVDIGSPYWMAPEVIQLIDASPTSDIWSLGCTVIEMIMGKPPYFDLNKMSVCMKMVQDDHPPLPENISEDLIKFLMKCFVKDPKNRATAKELLNDPWIKRASQDKESKKDKMKKSNSITALPRYRVDKFGEMSIKSNEKSIEKINNDLRSESKESPSVVGGGYSLKQKKKKKPKKRPIQTKEESNMEDEKKNDSDANEEKNGMHCVEESSNMESKEDTTSPKLETKKNILQNPSLKHLNHMKSNSLDIPLSGKKMVKISDEQSDDSDMSESRIEKLKMMNNSSPTNSQKDNEISNNDLSNSQRVNVSRVKDHIDLPRAISLSHVEKHFGFNTRDVGRLMNNQEKKKNDHKNTLPHKNKKPKSFVKNCQSCDTSFGVSNWRYQCRGCEGTFCKKCLTKKMAVPKISTSRPVRVCLSCFNNLMLS